MVLFVLKKLILEDILTDITRYENFLCQAIIYPEVQYLLSLKN